MIGIDHDSVDRADSQEIYHDTNYERESSDSWGRIYILIRSLQDLSKQIETSKLQKKQCSLYCKELNIKSEKLIQELNG